MSDPTQVQRIAQLFSQHWARDRAQEPLVAIAQAKQGDPVLLQANALMAEAFIDAMGVALDVHDGAHQQLWAQAWQHVREGLVGQESKGSDGSERKLSIVTAMQVKSILAKAAKCKTNSDAGKLLDTLEHVFSSTQQLSHLPQYNRDFDLENEGPFVKFEFNNQLSEHYITMIQPEIRVGKLMILVETNHMLDGLGVNSKAWETVDGLEDIIEADDYCTIESLAEQAKQKAIAHHTELIMRVGVPKATALEAAKKSWPAEEIKNETAKHDETAPSSLW